MRPARNNLRLVADVAMSRGCRVRCADTGRMLLDAFGNIGSLPLGYNHPRLLQCAERFAHHICQRQANGHAPSVEYMELHRSTLPRIKPDALHTAWTHTDVSGTMAVENAVKACLVRSAQRGAPLAPMIGFDGGFHGRSIATLGLCRPRDEAQSAPWVDIPHIVQWNSCPFPADGVSEEESLSKVRARLELAPAAGVIVEPVQAEGGDRHASPRFFRELARLCLEADVPLVVDEVQTGLYTTGRLWAHDHWGLDDALQRAIGAVIFSKKTGVAGFFASPDLLVDHERYISSTWMGDTLYGMVLDAVIDECAEERLGERVTRVGGKIMEELRGIDEIATSVRGAGTMIAFDVGDDESGRDAAMWRLQAAGLLVGRCGSRSLRLRPPLTLTQEEGAELIEAVKGVLTSG